MAREINAELLDTKIEKAQKDLVKAKHRYDAAAATLKDLLDKGFNTYFHHFLSIFSLFLL